ncbi:hypothetical protein Bca52824_006982 [Brassica carinata]|uniref:F-box domain-containing protein n=1 Tax=Brassica carinata TaxID=52824 RepID=A0A8X8B4Z8_BRACI|nr:hypothetical protein Bca52824_006977 [Brassica carinata]KAG2324254.1 hypothetical protein Bca52824_006982 [Brassica carinata]
MTTILDLPDNLLDEILSRVPLDSTRAVRSTCKAWNASFYRRFAKTMEGSVKVASEEARESGESRMLVMMDHNVYLTSVVVNENPSTKRLGKLTYLTHEQVKISQVFHCDGLLLCILKDDKRLVVWNPCLGETRWIEGVQDANVQDKYKYALGYEEDSCRRHYKILKFTDAAVMGFSSYETYDFGTSSWTHQRFTEFRGIDEFCDRGVSLKGNTYWWPKDLVSLSCVGDEKLLVLIQPWKTLVIDIWISYKIDEQKVLWSKFLSVDMGPLTDLIRTDGGFFVEEEKKLAMFFSKDTVKVFGEDGYFRELDLGESSNKECWPLVCPYVPSSVQIKPLKTSSEKRRYDENMSRYDNKRIKHKDI